LFSTKVATQGNGSIQAIQVTPGDTTLNVGEEIQFTATVIDIGVVVIRL